MTEEELVKLVNVGLAASEQSEESDKAFIDLMCLNFGGVHKEHQYGSKDRNFAANINVSMCDVINVFLMENTTIEDYQSEVDFLRTTFPTMSMCILRVDGEDSGFSWILAEIPVE